MIVCKIMLALRHCNEHAIANVFSSAARNIFSLIPTSDNMDMFSGLLNLGTALSFNGDLSGVDFYMLAKAKLLKLRYFKSIGSSDAAFYLGYINSYLGINLTEKSLLIEAEENAKSSFSPDSIEMQFFNSWWSTIRFQIDIQNPGFGVVSAQAMLDFLDQNDRHIVQRMGEDIANCVVHRNNTLRVVLYSNYLMDNARAMEYAKKSVTYLSNFQKSSMIVYPGPISWLLQYVFEYLRKMQEGDLSGEILRYLHRMGPENHLALSALSLQGQTRVWNPVGFSPLNKLLSGNSVTGNAAQVLGQNMSSGISRALLDASQMLEPEKTGFEITFAPDLEDDAELHPAKRTCVS